MTTRAFTALCFTVSLLAAACDGPSENIGAVDDAARDSGVFAADVSSPPPDLASPDAGLRDVHRSFHDPALALPDAAPIGTPPDAGPDAPLDHALEPDAAFDTSVDAGPEVPPPPPLSGGTLAVARDGVTAIVSDPDGDRVLLVDLSRHEVTATLALEHGDEPGRIVEDDHHRAHIVLRGAGAIITVDLDTRSIVARRAVCSIPRGIAWDPATDSLQVVCMGGELVTLPAAGGASTRRVQLDRDLRDVTVLGDRLLVTRFRRAETLVVDGRGTITQRISLDSSTFMTNTAWRAAPAPDGGFWLLHQRVDAAPVSLVASGTYSGGAFTSCPGAGAIVRPGLTLVRPPFAPVVLPDVPNAPLAIDVAVSPGGDRVALAIPGNLGAMDRAQLLVVPTTSSTSCLVGDTTAWAPSGGQVVAVAYTPAGQLVVQTRTPATIVVVGSGVAAVALGGAPANHAGHRLFHTNPTGLIACASCHAEGDDDGRVWTFDPTGPRRTQYLRGGLLGSEPFHWNGDERDFSALVAEVMVRRMSAPAPSAADASSLAHWIDALPVRPRPMGDPAAVARGEALFRNGVTGCNGCHAGPRYTNSNTVDVGTGGRFQVPTLLGLAWRAPYLHNGCAATLRDRFGHCGGGDSHGHTSQLTSADIDDLVAFLESL